jgi:hypothetical protein
VRGLLAGLKAVGVPAFYPGRDWVTVDGRPIAIVSIDVGPEGGLLFEAILAVSRDFSAYSQPVAGSRLAARLSRLSSEELTSLHSHLGVELGVADVAEVTTRGYARQFGITFEASDAAPEAADVSRTITEQFLPPSWLMNRVVQPFHDHHGSIETMLGTLEAHFSLGPGRALNDIVLAGDFIANATAVESLESRLRGCPVDGPTIDRVAAGVFASPENFVLGIGDTTAIPRAILAGVRE